MGICKRTDSAKSVY